MDARSYSWSKNSMIALIPVAPAVIKAALNPKKLSAGSVQPPEVRILAYQLLF